MKSRIVRICMLIASVMGLLVTTTPPAEATWVKNVTLLGEAILLNCDGNGLGYPTWTSGLPTTTVEVPETRLETKTGPKGEPEVNITVRNGSTCDFSFQANCVKVSVSKKNGVDTCVISAIGTVTGFCGLSSGKMTAVLTNLSNTIQPKPNVVTDFKFSESSNTITISGGDSTQNIHGEVSIIESMQHIERCANKTTTSFLVHGDVVIKKTT